jgi:hypothetical protein
MSSIVALLTVLTWLMSGPPLNPYWLRLMKL